MFIATAWRTASRNAVAGLDQVIAAKPGELAKLRDEGILLTELRKRRSASVTYRLRRWPLYLVAFNPLVVLRLRFLPQVIGGGLFGSGQRAGRRSTHAAQALKDEAQAIHADSVP
jgi:hypothetical protein